MGEALLLHRKIQENWLWQENRTYSKAEAWIDLLFLAETTVRKELIGNRVLIANRGQVFTSQNDLMKKWGWGKQKLRKFLELLENESMITKESDNKKTLITIENYEKYQNEPDHQPADQPANQPISHTASSLGMTSVEHNRKLPIDLQTVPQNDLQVDPQPDFNPTIDQTSTRLQPDDSPPQPKNHTADQPEQTLVTKGVEEDHQTSDQPATRLQSDFNPTKQRKSTLNTSTLNNLNTKKNTSSAYPEDFEEFWKAYPRTRKVSKKKAHGCWKARLKEDAELSPADLLLAAEHYADACKDDETPEKYIKHPTTFLGTDKPFEDYLEAPEAQPIYDPVADEIAKQQEFYRLLDEGIDPDDLVHRYQ